MNEFILQLEEKYNEYLSNVVEAKKNSKVNDVIEIAEEIISKKTYSSQDFLERMRPYFDYIRNEKDKGTIIYLSDIFKFNYSNPGNAMFLDDKQIEVFKDLVEELKKVKEQTKSFKDFKYLENIIKTLKEENYFVDIDGLRRAFEDLSIDLNLQAEILFQVIENNLKKSKDYEFTFEDDVLDETPVETTEVVEEVINEEQAEEIHEETPVVREPYVPVEIEIIPKENKEETKSEVESNINMATLNRVLSENKLLSADFSSKYYDMILQYGNIDKISRTLNVLSLYIEPSKLLDDGDGHKLAKIMLLSSPENIAAVFKICKENNVVFEDHIKYHYDVLISKNEYIPKTKENADDPFFKDEESFENFINNVSYFKDKGLNIRKVLQSASNIVNSDSEKIQKTYEILSEQYDVNFDEKSLSCLSSPAQTIKSVDLLYEILPNAKEFIDDQKSFLYIGSKDDYYAIKYFNSEEKPLVIVNPNRTKKNTFNKEVLTEVKKEHKKEFESLNRKVSLSSEEVLNSIEDKLGLVRVLKDYDYKSLVKNDFIKLLEENFKVSDQLYIINDVDKGTETRVSRIKVFRVCSQLLEKGFEINSDTIIYALSYRSLLNDDDVYNIEHFNELARSSRGTGRVK